MEVDVAEVEVHAGSVQDEGITVGITEVQSGPYRIKAGHRNSGHGRNWVTPWLKMSNSSTCPYDCDGYELDMV